MITAVKAPPSIILKIIFAKLSGIDFKYVLIVSEGGAFHQFL
jgi:hypothetical protein